MRSIVLFLFASSLWADPALVQQTSTATCSATSGTTVSCVLGGAPTNGNALVLNFGSNPNTATISSISETGATWNRVTGSNTGRNSEIWLACNVSSASATITVTVGATLAGSGGLGNVSEWSGLNGSCPGDTQNGATGSGNTQTTATLTTTNAKDLIVANTRPSGGTYSSGPTSSFIALNTPTANSFFPAYIIVSATGSYSTSWATTGTTTSWDASIAAFKSTASGTNSLTPAHGRVF